MDCPRCEGTGLCAECKGAGHIRCPNCEGNGYRTTGRGATHPCKPCGGRGTLDCSTRCSSCEGSGQITADLQRRVRERYQVRWDNTSPLQRASFALLFVNLTVYALQAYGPLPLRQFFAEWCYSRLEPVLHGQLWRLFTPMFFHVGWWHVLLNGLFLLRYCPPIEGLYGSRRFLALYVFAGFTGNVLSLLGNCVFEGAYWAGVGASTSLMGVAAAYVGLHRRWGLFDRDSTNAWVSYVVGVLVAGFALHSIFPVDNWGHAGGLLGGLLFAMLARRPTGH